MTGIEKLISGRSLDIYAITVHGDCLVREFIDGLESADQKKVLALLQRAAEHGTPGNTEKFKKLEDNIWEFKSFQVRILCTLEGRNAIILTHGFIKKRDKAPPNEIARAKELLAAYRSRR
jgi:phage-related protein